MISSLHNSTHLPEMEINTKTACGGVKNKKATTTTTTKNKKKRLTHKRFKRTLIFFF